MININPKFSGSVTGTQAVVSLSGSFSGSGTIENAQTASKIANSASFGLGMEPFVYDGSSNQIITLDTSSAHFTVGVSQSQAPILTALSASFSTSQTALSGSASTARDLISSSAAAALTAYSASEAGNDDALSASFSTSQTALSASASTARDALSASLTTTDQSLSASIAALSQSSAAERLNFVVTSSIIGFGNIIEFTKGDNSTYENQIITSSFVKSVNGILPSPNGNVSMAIAGVQTGTSASLIAAAATADEGDVWVISGESGSALTGSNGEAYIFNSTSSEWLEISNLDQPQNDARYVLKTGDIMTGQLLLNGNPTLPLGATPRQYVDNISASFSTSQTALSASDSTAREFYVATSSITSTTQSFTLGNGTVYENYIQSASYALTASYALSSSTEIKKEVSSSYADTASITTGMSYRESVTGAATYTITHNLSEQYPIVQSYDTATNVMTIPSSVTATDANNLDIVFASAFTGIVIVQK